VIGLLSGVWTRTDRSAEQAAGLQHVYGSSALRSPSADVVPLTHSDCVTLVRAHLTGEPAYQEIARAPARGSGRLGDPSGACLIAPGVVDHIEPGAVGLSTGHLGGGRLELGGTPVRHPPAGE
jgi:hypothetical protein